MDAHMYEITALKKDINSWLEDLQRAGKKPQFDLASNAIRGLFDQIPDIESEELKASDVVADLDETESKVVRSQREMILKHAKKQVGVPYLFAGNFTPVNFSRIALCM